MVGPEGGSRRVGLVNTAFGVICEVEPATKPDLMRVRHQIGVMSRVASGFLIPDNHIGRATVSSIAVAHEVGLMGGRLPASTPETETSSGFGGTCSPQPPTEWTSSSSSTETGPSEGLGRTTSRFDG
jgi:hypothetical protein